jgi:hypothetical protein
LPDLSYIWNESKYFSMNLLFAIFKMSISRWIGSMSADDVITALNFFKANLKKILIFKCVLSYIYVRVLLLSDFLYKVTIKNFLSLLQL